ncbi:hypothetical protein Pyn_36675 [Prunus yedoensis var. nudiflora]|uniref:Uncharacterized protein n=1 Tax=Prunus yedoensis var. nudiflora TaxID=2094558 RepID=A0A314XXC4_PRUYE|nr:hypothetical protein Pyn_36675 [Prunus yedoensis var. nudiflora]
MNITHDNKKALSFVEEAEEYDRFNNTSTTLSLQISNRDYRASSSAATPLDLNLPAPEEEHLETKFPFGPKKEQVIVFSTSPLVGCHY